MRTVRATTALVLLLVAASALAATPAEVRTAQRKTQEGARQLEDGHAELALHLFQEAYALSENTRYQYNIGVACAALSRDTEALEAFERFVAEARGITAEHRLDAEAKIDALRRKVAALEISGESGAEVHLDARRLGVTPLERAVRVDAGPHTVTAHKEGFHPFERQLQLGPGARTRVELALTALPAPPPAPVVLTARPEPPAPLLPPRPRQQPPETSRGWLWVGLGATVIAGVLVSALLLGRAGANPTCPPDVETCVGR
jgi:hypothetical protein